jgi:hypothetical protein
MSGPDVHNNEMDAMYDLDDAAVEALLRGHGDDAALREALGSVRGFYASDAPALSPGLASFIAAQSEVVEPLTRPEMRPARVRAMRSRFAARTAAVAATFVAATGGLAAAGALPGPVQRAVSHAASEVGVHLPEGTNGVPGAGDENDPSNNHGTPGGGSDNSGSNAGNTPTSHPDNHGGEVSAVAHDDSQSGCDHGHAVAATASGKSDQNACPTTGGSTVPGDETHGNGKGAGHGSDAGDAGQHNGNGNTNSADDETPSTPPTTAKPGTQGDGSHGKSDDHQSVNRDPHTSQNDGGAQGDDGDS